MLQWFISKKSKQPKLASIKEAGNVFMMLFGAVGMVGVVGASTMTVMKGPVKTMAEVTKRTVAENNMIATGKLSLIAAGAQANNDCDSDLTIEPLEHGAAITGFTGGGQVPSLVGIAQQDPWGSTYAYCVWDHGTTIDDAACGGATQDRLRGSAAIDQYVLAIISAGPDGTFDTSCIDYVDASTPVLNKTAGSDDLVLGYTYAEAAVDLWALSDPDTALITKNLSVEDSGGTETFSLDAATGTLDLAGGIPSLNTDFLGAIGGIISVVSPITTDSSITTTGGANIVSSGGVSASGALSGSSLNVSGSATVGSLSAGSGAISGGAISGSSLNAGSGTISGGAISGSSLSSSGGLSVTGTSSLGTLNAGATTVSSLSAGSGAISGGAISGSSLNAGSGTISGGAISGSSLSSSGGLTVSGTSSLRSVTMNNNRISGLGTPSASTDAATKAYVDSTAAAAAAAAGGGTLQVTTTSGTCSASDGDSCTAYATCPGGWTRSGCGDGGKISGSGCSNYGNGSQSVQAICMRVN